MSKRSVYLEYLSLCLTLSYFFIHNIFLVLIGIIFSCYMININLIYTNKKISNQKLSKALNKSDKMIKNDFIKINSTEEDNQLTLVEAIEELGFIPSTDQNNNINSL